MNDNIKLQEDIIKADIKSVEKLWRNDIQDNTLSALLEKMTKDELVKVARKYSVKGITTLKKAEAVEKVKSVVLETYSEVLFTAEEGIVKFLKELLESDGIRKYECTDLVYSNYLRNRGIAFTGILNDELYTILPSEIIGDLQNILDKDLITSSIRNGEFIKAIAGLAYFYGVLSIEDVKMNLERIFSDSFTLENIYQFINLGEELGYDYVVDKNIIYHIDVEDIEKVVEMQQTSEVEWYKFDKKTLLKAGEPDYIESNKQGEKLKKVISELFVIDENILKEEMDNFVIAIKNEMDVNEAIEMFLEAYEIESIEEKNIFISELEFFAKSIRRWSLRGFSKDEVEKNEQRVVNEIKIGRNDPCICGSGKKYKKCCSK